MGIFDLSKAESAHHSMIGTVVGGDTTIKGEIASKGSVRVDGVMEGSINSESDILVAEKAAVKGNISGKRVIVAGEVRGDVSSSDSVEIKKNGKVFGNISSNKLLVDEGASYKGRVIMGEARQEPDDKGAEGFSQEAKEIIGL